MESRPRIIPELTIIDKVLEMTGLFLIVLLWLLTIYNFLRLPSSIPLHFSSSGEPDNYGNKATLFLIPFINTVLFILLSYLNKRPHLFNFPVKITPENAQAQYKNAIRLLRVMKLVIGIIFTTIVIVTWTAFQQEYSKPPGWLLPFIFGIIIFPSAFFIIRSYTLKK
jgi:uncharacterized membrane protein